MFLTAILLLPFAMLVSSPSHGQAGEVDFAREVLPILSDNCFQCHGPDANAGREGDLRLDNEADVLRDRGEYAVVVAGSATASEMMQRVTSVDDDLKMPPPELGRELSDSQIETLRRWIDGGAGWGKHWAFERIERPDLESEEHKPSTRNPIDELIGRRLQAESLEPNPAADKRTLIRRLKLDLTGLPPTTEQVDAFLADESEDAWPQLIARTLDSPAFGERMAWDWLAAARYADTNGYQGDRERTMWPWRDWVVRSFNENMPYDQFSVLQIAGDLLPDASDEQVLATGFFRNHMINGEGGRIAEENRVDYVMDMTETMGTVWLGLTLNCCRCHDHKFDPLEQREYYQFTAFFNQTPVTGGGGDPQTPPVLAVSTPEQDRAVDEAHEAVRSLRTQVDERTQSLEQDAASILADLEEGTRRELEAIISTAVADRSNEQREQWQKHLRECDADLDRLASDLAAAEDSLRAVKDSIPKVMVMQDADLPRATFILDRGLYNQPGSEVSAQVPTALPPLQADGPVNRLALARWLMSSDHPLTARVTVNRFWQMLFGVGLVKTTEDFGVQGEYPVHKELLDWLAIDFIESGWDVKQLISLIVSSEAYQRSSSIPSRAAYERDPENRLLARGPRHRLPAWMLRDQALAASGLLNRTQGGPSAYPYQPTGVWEEATFGKKTYPKSDGQDLYRRSLYTFWRRIVGPTMFFDSAKRQVCEVKPLRTNTPMHALLLLNDETYVEAARCLATSLLLEDVETPAVEEESNTDELLLRGLTQRVLCREPSRTEIEIGLRSLANARSTFRKSPDQAAHWVRIGASDIESGVDEVELAAWTSVCLNWLNLDETLNKE